MTAITEYFEPMLSWIAATTTTARNYAVEASKTALSEGQNILGRVADQVQLLWNYMLPHLQQCVDLMKTHLGVTGLLSLSSIALLYSAFNSYAQESVIMATIQTALAILAIVASGWLVGAYGIQNCVSIL